MGFLRTKAAIVYLAVAVTGLVAAQPGFALHSYASLSTGNGEIRDFAVTETGDIFVVGNVTNHTGLWVARLDSTLALVSSRTLSNPGTWGSLYDDALGVAISTDGTFFVAGTWHNGPGATDIWLAQFDQGLVLRASTTFNGSGNSWDDGSDLLLASDGSLYVAGRVVLDGGGYRPWIGRYNQSLGLISSAVLMSTAGQSNELVRDASDNLFLSGWSWGTDQDIWFAKFGPDLVFKSSIAISGPSGSNDIGAEIALTSAGGLAATGYIGNGPNKGFWTGVLDSSLVLQSSVTFQSPTISFESGALVDASGNIYVVGVAGTPADLYMRKLDGLLRLRESIAMGGYCGSSCGKTKLIGNRAYVVTGPGTALSRVEFHPVISPTGFGPASIGITSVAWSWADQTTEDSCRVIGGDSTELSGPLAYDTTSWVDAGLSTNTAYSRRLVALNAFSTATTSAQTLFTLAAPPSNLAISETFVSSFIAVWSTNTNPAGTGYRVDTWTVGGTTRSVTSTASSAVVTGLDFGSTYFCTVAAINGGGVASASGLTASTVTLRVTPTGANFLPGTGASILISPPSGDVTVDVPPAAFGVPVAVTARIPASYPPDTSSTGLAGTRVGVEIVLDRALQPARDVTISLSYRDADVVGLDRSRLVVARFDEGRGLWVPLVTRRDVGANRVTAATGHLSKFQLMAATPAVLPFAAKVFPNPLRPARGDTGMTFTNLPGGTRLRICTVLGELVRDLSTDSAGMARWDGLNSSGQRAASGVYLVYVQGGGQDAVIKVAVQR